MSKLILVFPLFIRYKETEFVTNELAVAGVLRKKHIIFKVVLLNFYALKSAFKRINRYLIDEIRLYLK